MKYDKWLFQEFKPKGSLVQWFFKVNVPRHHLGMREPQGKPVAAQE